ncbi:Mis6-domain-containing protein [Syncephalis plumigaleata]|nr:Mis6-domain-containing protein [Syncephalis plumigaleata]
MTMEIKSTEDTTDTGESSYSSTAINDKYERIAHLVNGIRSVDRKRKNETTIRGLINELNRIAIIYGLTKHDWINYLMKALVNTMFPRYQVPISVVVRIAGYLSNSNDYEIQAALIKWLIIVYDVIEDPGYLRKLYGVFFHFLDSETLAPYLCHLLYYLTGRENVQPYRVRRLLDLQARFGNNSAINKLLVLYKFYLPSIVLSKEANTILAHVSNPQQIADLFDASIQCVAPDKKWKESFRRQQESMARIRASSTMPTLLDPEVVTKRLKTSRSVMDHKVNTDSQSTETLNSLEDFVEVINGLELPNRAISIIDDKWAHHYLAIDSEDIIVKRLSHWIMQRMRELFFYSSGVSSQQELDKLLKKIATLTACKKGLLPVFQAFIQSILPFWNGHDHKDTLFYLISHWSIRSYENLSIELLQPLQHLLTTASVEWRISLIQCYTRLIANWVQIHWNELNASISSDESDIADTEIDKSSSSESLVVEEDHIGIQHAVLSFYETMASFPSSYRIPILVCMPYLAIYRCIFTTHIVSLSRVLILLVSYRDIYIRLNDYTSGLSNEAHKQFKQVSKSVCTTLFNIEHASSSTRIKAGLPIKLASCLDESYQLHGCLLDEFTSIVQIPALACIIRDYMEIVRKESIDSTIDPCKPISLKELKSKPIQVICQLMLACSILLTCII